MHPQSCHRKHSLHFTVLYCLINITQNPEVYVLKSLLTTSYILVEHHHDYSFNHEIQWNLNEKFKWIFSNFLLSNTKLMSLIMQLSFFVKLPLMKKCKPYPFTTVVTNGRMNEDNVWKARCTLGSRIAPSLSARVTQDMSVLTHATTHLKSDLTPWAFRITCQ